jgi:O-antigen/teichoic acid export membrane protein
LHKSTILKNSVLTFTRNIAIVILGLLTTILIARCLGPEKQGMYALIILLPNMLVTFMDLGIGPATVFYIGQQKYKVQTIISTNIILAIFLSFLSSIIGSLIILLYSESIFSGISFSILFSILGVLPILFLNNFIQFVFQGIEDFKSFNVIAVIGKVVNLIALIITIYLLPLDLKGALLSFVLGNLTSTILIIYIIIKKKLKISAKSFSIPFVKDSLKYGLKAHLSNIVSFLNYRADILLISYFLSPVSVGIYNIAVNIAERLWIVSKPVATVMLPRISSSDETKQNELTAVAARNVLFLSILFSIAFYFFADIVIDLLFGKEYMESSVALKILLPGITLFSVERILSNSLAGKGKPELNLYTSLFTVTCNIILNIILIPIYGLNGAALATSISYTLTFIIKIMIYTNLTKSKLVNILFLRKSDFTAYKNIIKALKRK